MARLASLGSLLAIVSVVVHAEGAVTHSRQKNATTGKWSWGSLPDSTKFDAQQKASTSTKDEWSWADVLSGPHLSMSKSANKATLVSNLRKQVFADKLPPADQVKPAGRMSLAPNDEKERPGYKKGKSKEPREVFGVSKIWWCVVAVILALLAFIACIPCVLTIAKRRRSS